MSVDVPRAIPASLVVLALSTAAWLWRAPLVPPAAHRRAVAVVGPVPRAAPPLADSTLNWVVAHAPFRASRQPSGTPYDPARGTTAPPPPERPPKPPLALTGIAWGAEPAAVIEGLPTTEAARVVRRGDIVGGLVIGRIGRDRVIVTGMDTTWILKVREVWR